MRKRSHRKHLKPFSLILIFISITVIIFLFRSIEKNISPSALKQGEHYSKLMANKIISRAVSDYLEENNYQYSDFSVVIYDENGKAVSIESLSGNINKVQSDLVVRISEEFSENKNIKVKIPIGSLTDSYLLAGKGFSVPLNICSAGNVDVKLKSEFTSAGINQTCHRISAVVSTEINSSVPLYSFSSKAEFEFLIAENVLVGDVPDYHRENF